MVECNAESAVRDASFEYPLKDLIQSNYPSEDALPNSLQSASTCYMSSIQFESPLVNNASTECLYKNPFFQTGQLLCQSFDSSLVEEIHTAHLNEQMYSMQQPISLAPYPMTVLSTHREQRPLLSQRETYDTSKLYYNPYNQRHVSSMIYSVDSISSLVINSESLKQYNLNEYIPEECCNVQLNKTNPFLMSDSLSDESLIHCDFKTIYNSIHSKTQDRLYRKKHRNGTHKRFPTSLRRSHRSVTGYPLEKHKPKKLTVSCLHHSSSSQLYSTHGIPSNIPGREDRQHRYPTTTSFSSSVGSVIDSIEEPLQVSSIQLKQLASEYDMTSGISNISNHQKIPSWPAMHKSYKALKRHSKKYEANKNHLFDQGIHHDIKRYQRYLCRAISDVELQQSPIPLEYKSVPLIESLQHCKGRIKNNVDASFDIHKILLSHQHRRQLRQTHRSMKPCPINQQQNIHSSHHILSTTNSLILPPQHQNQENNELLPFYSEELQRDDSLLSVSQIEQCPPMLSDDNKHQHDYPLCWSFSEKTSPPSQSLSQGLNPDVIPYESVLTFQQELNDIIKNVWTRRYDV